MGCPYHVLLPLALILFQELKGRTLEEVTGPQQMGKQLIILLLGQGHCCGPLCSSEVGSLPCRCCWKCLLLSSCASVRVHPVLRLTTSTL